jgi:hypothetical protein
MEPVTITFDPELVRHFLDRLRRSNAITLPPAEESWTTGNLLALAGACTALAAGHLLAELKDRKRLRDDHGERVEAVTLDAGEALFAAARYVSGLSMLVLAGQDHPAVEPHEATLTGTRPADHVRDSLSSLARRGDRSGRCAWRP